MHEQYTARFWDERYSSSTQIWSGNPNPQLMLEVADLTPGTALDAGCGEGADTLWLAHRGWRVTAIDISTVALDRAAARAEPDTADRITWEQVDLIGWAPDGRTYDLVSAQFVHFPPALRDPLFAGLAASVAPAGTLLIVGHHPADLLTTVHRPHEPDLFYSAEQLADSLDPDRWDILAAEARPRPATDPAGQPVTLHDTVLRARRRP